MPDPKMKTKPKTTPKPSSAERKRNAYISMPMRGKEDVRAEFVLLRDELEKRHPDLTVINDPTEARDVTPLEMLGRSITVLGRCDVAWFAPGWEKARGCKIEHDCCEAYGVDIIN